MSAAKEARCVAENAAKAASDAGDAGDDASDSASAVDAPSDRTMTMPDGGGEDVTPKPDAATGDGAAAEDAAADAKEDAAEASLDAGSGRCFRRDD